MNSPGIGQVLQVLHNTFLIPPGEGVYPKQDGGEAAQQHIQGMELAGVRFFVFQDLLKLCFIVDLWVVKHISEKRKGRLDPVRSNQ